MSRRSIPWGAIALAFVFSLSIAGCSDDDGGSCEGIADACDSPGATRCGVDGVQTCQVNAGGCLVWTTTQACSTGFVCENSQCICDDDCANGDDRCDGDVVQRCAADGDGCWRWIDEEDCTDSDEVCDDTVGAICVGTEGCGNSIREGTEVCDAYDFGGQSCESFGYTAGFLVCSPNCDAIDFSGCILAECGNNTLEGTEVCDGSELDGETCQSLGLGGGTLACDASCSAFDTSACTSAGEICDNNVDDDSDGDADCADTDCAAHATCALGYNFDFEDWTASNPPTRYEANPTTDASYTQSQTIVNTGASAAQCQWFTTANRDLDHQLSLPVTASTEYTFHAWVFDNEAVGRARAAIAWSSGTNDYGTNYSSDSGDWQEVVVTAVAPAGATGLTPRLRLYDQPGFDPLVGAVIYTDDWAVTEHHPYAAGPTLDTDTLEAADDGGAGFVNIGVNDEGVLYLATQAGTNSTTDRAVYLWVDGIDSTATVPAPWNKAGTLFAPSATGILLAFMDEGDSNFCGWWWWDSGVTSWVQLTTDVDCYDSFGDTTNLLSGWLDAATQLLLDPEQLPALVWIASVEYGTADAASVVTQMPAAVTADDDITDNEVVQLHRVQFLSGKIHP